MLANEILLEKITRYSRDDDRIVALIAYGSYTRNEFHRFSDIDLYVFVQDDDFETFDDRQWIESLGDVCTYFENSYGVKTAIFRPKAIRGEFHFCPHRHREQLLKWEGSVLIGALERTILVDKSGDYTELMSRVASSGLLKNTEEFLDSLVNEFVNGTIFEWSVLSRKDLFRAYFLHQLNLHRVAQLLSIKHDRWEHLYSPRELEEFLPESEYRGFISLASSVEFEELRTKLEQMCLFFRETGRELFSRKHLEILSVGIERVLERSYRIEAAIIRDNQVLLVQHTYSDGSAGWLFPGGGRQPYESDGEALQREIREETNLELQSYRLIDEIELPNDEIYYSSKLFWCEAGDGDPSPGYEPEDESQEIYEISSVTWVDFSDTGKIPREALEVPMMLERFEKLREFSEHNR